MPADPLAWLVSLEGVPSAYAAARDGIDVMLRDRGLRRTSPDLTAESLLRGAHASAVLEGSASSLDEVREGSGDETAQATPCGCRPSCCRWSPLLNRSPLQALARLHALAGAGSVPDDQLGRPRETRQRSGSRTWRRLLIAPHRGAGAAHRGDGARGAADRRAVRLPQRHRRPGRRAPGPGRARRRREVAGGAGGRPPGQPGGVRVQPAGYADGGRAGVHAWALYAAEAFAPAPRRARCGEPSGTRSDSAVTCRWHPSSHRNLECHR